MGTVEKKLLIFALLLNVIVNAQIIKLEKGDSIKLIKKEELKEDGLTFYKDEYSFIIYNKDNIIFNKKRGYKYQEFAGGMRYCDKCKKETYGFSIKKVKGIPLKKSKYYKLNYLFQNLNKYSVGGGYFLISGIYYKNLGMPIE